MAYTTLAKVKSIGGITTDDWDTEIGYHITYVDNYLGSRLGAMGIGGSTVIEGIATDLVIARFFEDQAPSFGKSLEQARVIRQRAEKALDEYIAHRTREGDRTPPFTGSVYIG